METWYSPFPEEVEKIIELASERPSGTAIVEIGAYEGHTTVQLARVFQTTPIYAIDPWNQSQDAAGNLQYQAFIEATRPYSNVICIRKSSKVAQVPVPVGFVFHDGDHKRPDFKRWYDALVSGGILVVHDIYDHGWPAVRKAFDALPGDKQEFIFERPTTGQYSSGGRGLGVVRK